LLITLAATICLGARQSRVAAADAAPPTVIITRPAEGESFYAGPPVPLVSVTFTGWATSPVYRSEQLDVLAQIWQHEALVGQVSTTPLPSGQFSFDVALNGDTGLGQDSYGMGLTKLQSNCGVGCHYRAPLDLPRGATVLRVIVTDPAGLQATAERSLTVDRAGYATVPVQLVLEPSTAAASLEHVPVSASARLYLWRVRNASDEADASGQALLTVEALSEAPTTYLVQVTPVVVDGVLYAGLAPAAVTLEPGATEASTITLRVRASYGRMAGQLSLIGSGGSLPVTLWAIHLPEGRSTTLAVEAPGPFSLEPLPLGDYVLAAEVPAGYSLEPKTVDLSRTAQATLDLPLVAGGGRRLSVSVQGEDGSPLPFAWARVEPLGQQRRAFPLDGSVTLEALSADPVTLTAWAPGYFARAALVAGGGAPAAVILVRQPETQLQAWGTGHLVVPPEARVTPIPGGLRLEQGWLWGRGDTSLLLAAGDAAITVSGGAFALEVEPGGRAWFYLLAGQASLQMLAEAQTVVVAAGEMVALGTGASPQPVACAALVSEALHGQASGAPEPHWQPSLTARARDQLARMGIGTAQLVTLVIYFLALTLIAAAPIWGLRWLRRRRLRRTQI
jgi:hypothetical protein